MKFYPYLLLLLILPAAAQTYGDGKLRDLMGDPEDAAGSRKYVEGHRGSRELHERRGV